MYANTIALMSSISKEFFFSNLEHAILVYYAIKRYLKQMRKTNVENQTSNVTTQMWLNANLDKGR
jgi:hypothetical protein